MGRRGELQDKLWITYVLGNISITHRHLSARSFISKWLLIILPRNKRRLHLKQDAFLLFFLYYSIDWILRETLGQSIPSVAMLIQFLRYNGGFLELRIIKEDDNITITKEIWSSETPTGSDELEPNAL